LSALISIKFHAPQVDNVSQWEFSNEKFIQKIQIFIKLPNGGTVSLFPKLGTSLESLFLLEKLRCFDPKKFYLKPNKLFSIFTLDHHLSTINLNVRIRGGSGELDELKKQMESMMKKLNNLSNENLFLKEKLEQSERLQEKAKSFERTEETSSEDVSTSDDERVTLEQLTPFKTFPVFSSRSEDDRSKKRKKIQARKEKDSQDDSDLLSAYRISTENNKIPEKRETVEQKAASKSHQPVKVS
jgi:regulator of replication initiation timing